MHTELMKSLLAAGFSEVEAKDILEKSDNSGEDKGESKEDWSEEKEQELEKSAKEANDLLELYKTKKPTSKEEPKPEKTEKSETESDLIKAISSDEIQEKISDLVKSQVSEIESVYADKLSEIQKSLESLNSLTGDIYSLQEKIEVIGKQTPPQKSILKAEDAILEKAMQGGVKVDDNTHLSQKLHKEQICNELGNLISENANTEFAKSIEVELTNFVMGASGLGIVAKTALKDKKNIVVL